LAPQWGLVTPFALSWPLQFLHSEPALLGSKEYRRQAEQVLAFSAALGDFQKVIAEYWADRRLVWQKAVSYIDPH
jgi:hypothetical protein